MSNQQTRYAIYQNGKPIALLSMESWTDRRVAQDYADLLNVDRKPEVPYEVCEIGPITVHMGMPVDQAEEAGATKL